MQFQQEMLWEVQGEVQPLLEQHYQELTLHKDRVKLSPMWERYAAMERDGALSVYTARFGGFLMGYAAFFVGQHLHYQDLKVATNDVLFMHPDVRGSAGIRLIRFCEAELSKCGVHKIAWHAKLTNDLQEILKHMGYAQEEVIMAKLIGDK